MSAPMRKALAGLWSDLATERLAACRALSSLQIDMVDLREAQPALVWALGDPDPAVRLAALEVTELRADLGCDVGLAVPALVERSGDPDVALRRRVWRTLRFASRRTAFVARMPELLSQGLADSDPEVRAQAEAMRREKR